MQSSLLSEIVVTHIPTGDEVGSTESVPAAITLARNDSKRRYRHHCALFEYQLTARDLTQPNKQLWSVAADEAFLETLKEVV